MEGGAKGLNAPLSYSPPQALRLPPLEHRGLLWQLHSRASWRRPSLLQHPVLLLSPDYPIPGQSLGCNTHHWVACSTPTP